MRKSKKWGVEAGLSPYIHYNTVGCSGCSNTMINTLKRFQRYEWYNASPSNLPIAHLRNDSQPLSRRPHTHKAWFRGSKICSHTQMPTLAESHMYTAHVHLNRCVCPPYTCACTSAFGGIIGAQDFSSWMGQK